MPDRCVNPHNSCMATYLAMTKSSLTMRLPSPMYFCTSSLPDTLMKVQSVWCATALARRVLPVPGGPYSKTPYKRGQGPLQMNKQSETVADTAGHCCVHTSHNSIRVQISTASQHTNASIYNSASSGKF